MSDSEGVRVSERESVCVYLCTRDRAKKEGVCVGMGVSDNAC